jgi:hypothetical protein
MTEPFLIAGFAIVKARNRYSVFALNSGCVAGSGHGNGVRVHAWLREVASSYSTRAVIRHLHDVILAHSSTPWVVTNGHHAGATTCVSGHCDERFVTINHAYDAAQDPLDLQGTIIPFDLALRLEVVAANDPTPLIHEPERPPLVHVDVPAGFFAANPPKSIPATGIRSFGVELECMVPNSSLAAVRALAAAFYTANPDDPRMVIKTDGSIQNMSSYAGERMTFWSPNYSPCEILFWSTSFEEMGVWLRKMYDEFGVRTNQSCGFHIHVRPFKNRLWQFATRGYFEQFIAAYRQLATEKGPRFESRLSCHWCVPAPWNAREIRNLAGHIYTNSYGQRVGVLGERIDRYRAVNLDSIGKCKKNTIEHRLMPNQETAADALEAVRWVVATASRIITQSLVIDAETAHTLANLRHSSPLYHAFPEPVLQQLVTGPVPVATVMGV